MLSHQKHTRLRETKNITYANAIRSAMFSMIITRPDLTYSISFLSRIMSNHGKPHWVVLKCLLKCIAGILSNGLVFEKRFENLTLKVM